MQLLSVITLALLGAEPTAGHRTEDAANAAVEIASVAPLPGNLRFVWVPPWLENPATEVSEVEQAAAITSTSLSMAMGANTHPPPPTMVGSLLVVDLARLADSDVNTLARLVLVWEKLATGEPYFHVTRADSPGVVFIDPDLADQHIRLKALTGSSVPVVRWDWLVFDRLMSSTRGGLYYEFQGFTTDTTTLDQWLTRHGVFRSTTDLLKGNRQVWMARSGVTTRPRTVTLAPSLAGIGWVVYLTFDVDSDTVRDPAFDPLLHYVGARFNGGEGIAVGPDGLPRFVLFNGAGVLVGAAPQNLAHDGTVPGQYDTTLTNGMSCIRCHTERTLYSDDNTTVYEDGYKALRNDLDDLLSHPDGFDVFGGLGLSEDVVARISQLNAGSGAQLVFPLTLSRAASNTATREATAGLMQYSDFGRLFRVYQDQYNYTPVSEARAVAELGYSDASFRACVPKQPEQVDGISPDDAYTALLAIGRDISREKFENSYVDLARRARRHWLEQQE